MEYSKISINISSSLQYFFFNYNVTDLGGGFPDASHKSVVPFVESCILYRGGEAIITGGAKIKNLFFSNITIKANDIYFELFKLFKFVEFLVFLN